MESTNPEIVATAGVAEKMKFCQENVGNLKIPSLRIEIKKVFPVALNRRHYMSNLTPSSKGKRGRWCTQNLQLSQEMQSNL